MYKIYINETPLYLTTIPESLEVAMPDDQNLVLRYAGKKKFLLNIIDQLEKSSRFEKVVVCSKNIDKLWADFRDVYKIIEAAGGVVFNQNDETLLIYRRDYWDLPKGKIDKGESPLQAALREVEEETGLTKLLPGPPIAETWHTYKEKGHRILKRTFWFRMDTDQLELELEKEEDIEKAKWITIRQFLSNPGKVYGNILDVLRKTLTIT